MTGHQTVPLELAPTLQEIVKVARPHQVVLFGSRARGDAGPSSDYDLLVIVPSEAKTLALYKAIHRALKGTGMALDIVLATPEDLTRYREAWMTIYPTVLREGITLYAT